MVSANITDQWTVDSGATCHIAGYRKIFVANGGKDHIKGKQTCKIEMVNEIGIISTVTLTYVTCAPIIEANSLYINKLANKDFKVNMCEIMHGEKQSQMQIKICINYGSQIKYMHQRNIRKIAFIIGNEFLVI